MTGSAEKAPTSVLDTPVYPIIWSELDPAQTLDHLDELADWVTWLQARYQLDTRTIPTCWPSHGELVEELSALRLAWHTAYGWEATAADPLRWHHDYALTRERLTDWTARTGCRPGHHRPPASDPAG